MDFIPEQPTDVVEVPFYEDVKGDGGWQGHRTRKSERLLQGEISKAVSRLGGMVTGFQKGAFGSRVGYRIHYTVSRPGGELWPGRMDIAALPVRNKGNMEKSLIMSLYMVRNTLDGSWFLQQLSPGFIPLLPWMLVPGKKGKNFTEQMTDDGMLQLPTGDVVDGEFEEIS